MAKEWLRLNFQARFRADWPLMACKRCENELVLEDGGMVCYLDC